MAQPKKPEDVEKMADRYYASGHLAHAEDLRAVAETMRKLYAVADAAAEVCEAKTWEDEDAEQDAGDRMANALNVLHGLPTATNG